MSFYGCLFFVCPDEPLPRQSSQVQAAEDILDKYRNIKRSSPSDGATGGTSYDGTGGENETARRNVSRSWSAGPHSAPLGRYLRRGRRPRLLQRRRSAEHLSRRSPRLGQPDGAAARLQVLLQVCVVPQWTSFDSRLCRDSCRTDSQTPTSPSSVLVSRPVTPRRS